MTQIQRLRQQLDELGIEWDVLRQAKFTDYSVVYESNGIKWVVLEHPYSEMFSISNFKDELSLEQVIRATIGDEPTSAYDDEDNELLPCPFCGGENLTISVDGGIAPDYLDFDTQAKIWTENKYVTTCTVICDLCGATVQGYSARNDNTTDIADDAKADCFKKWNGRASK